MKADELMLGDYVKAAGYDWLRVTELNNNYACFSHRWKGLKYKDIEPIPISQQILENNGFKLVDGHTSHWKIDGNGYDDIQISGVPDPKHHAVLTLNAHKTSHTGCGHGFYRFICDMDIQYVHELQHIMRICNIGKEIRL